MSMIVDPIKMIDCAESMCLLAQSDLTSTFNDANMLKCIFAERNQAVHTLIKTLYTGLAFDVIYYIIVNCYQNDPLIVVDIQREDIYQLFDKRFFYTRNINGTQSERFDKDVNTQYKRDIDPFVEVLMCKMDISSIAKYLNLLNIKCKYQEIDWNETMVSLFLSI